MLQLRPNLILDVGSSDGTYLSLADRVQMQTGSPYALIADEALSALDVSVQAQVLSLLEDIRERLGLSMLFITHDLRVAARICDSVAVMLNGRVVEWGPTAEVFGRPQHEYTRALFAAAPGQAWLSHRGVAPAGSEHQHMEVGP